MDGKKGSSGRLAFLDAARGVAALLVVLEHGIQGWFPQFGEWSARHVHLGRVGVLLFLTISGFIIPQSIQQAGSNARFWLRRFFRLFPAYWLCILIVLLYVGLGGKYRLAASNDPGTWLVNLTMCQGFLGYPHLLDLFWTLHLELIIYLSCSLLLALRLFRHARLLLAATAAAVLFAGTILARWRGQPLVLHPVLYFAAPMVGFVAYDLLHRRGSWLFSLALLVAIVAVPLPIYLYNYRWLLPEHTRVYVHDYCVHYLGAYSLFFLMACLHGRRLHWSACRLGRISYSTYLMHAVLVVLLVDLPGPPWLRLGGLIVASVLVSEVCFRLVEEPGIALGRALERRLFRAKAQAANPDAGAERQAA